MNYFNIKNMFIFINVHACMFRFFFYRKKLLEIVEFIKKYVYVPQISQQPKPAIQWQKEVIVDVQEKEKHKMLNNLPKVGVCQLIYVIFFILI